MICELAEEQPPPELISVLQRLRSLGLTFPTLTDRPNAAIGLNHRWQCADRKYSPYDGALELCTAVSGKHNMIPMPAVAMFLDAIVAEQSSRRVVSSSLLPALFEFFRRRARVQKARPTAYTTSMCQPLLNSAVRNPCGIRSSLAARHNIAVGRDMAT